VLAVGTKQLAAYFSFFFGNHQQSRANKNAPSEIGLKPGEVNSCRCSDWMNVRLLQPLSLP
jgi:hypothetical protein